MNSFSEEFNKLRRSSTANKKDTDLLGSLNPGAVQSSPLAALERMRSIQRYNDSVMDFGTSVRQRQNAANELRYTDPLTELARETAERDMINAQLSKMPVTDYTGFLEKSIAGAKADAKSYAQSLLDQQTGSGLGRVAPGMPGGGGRGVNTVADLDPTLATPGDYMAAIARDQQKSIANSRVGRTVSGAVGSAAEGLIGTAGTLADFAQRYNVGSYYTNTEDWENATKRAKESPSWEIVDTLHDKADELNTRSALQIEAAKKGLGWVGRTLVDAGVSGVQMLGDAAINAVLPGMGLAAMGVRSFGNAAGEARREGAEVGKQVLYGLTNAAVEVLSEKIGDVPGIYGGGWLDDAVGSVVGKWNANPVLKRAAMAAASGLGESVEEFAAGLIEPGLKSIYNDKGYFQNYSKEDWTDMGNAMASAFLLGGLGGLSPNVDIPSAPSPMADIQALSQQIDNDRAYYDQAVQQYGPQSAEAERLRSALQSAGDRLSGMKRSAGIAEETQAAAPLAQAREEAPTAQPEISLPGQEVGDVTRSIVRQIESDPEQLARMGINTKGKTGSQVREEIRAALEAQNDQQKAANTSAVDGYAESEYASGRISETGANIFKSFYTGSQSPSAYVQGMTAAYNAGLNGTDINSVNTEALSNTQRDAAYLAGQAARTQAQKAAPNIEAVRQFTETEIDAGRMTEDGARLINDFYDGKEDAGAYIAAVTNAYNAGLEGKGVQSATSPVLTRSQRDAAYMAGQTAARQGQTELLQATAPAQAEAQSTAQSAPQAQAAAPQAQAQQIPVQQAQPTVSATQQQTVAEAKKTPAVRAKKPGLVQDENTKKLTRGEARLLDAFGKVSGTEIRMVQEITNDEGKASGGQGRYRDGVIEVTVNAKDPYLTVAVHEMVHRIDDLSPEAYNSLRRVVENNLGEDQMQKAEFLRSLGYPDGTDLTQEVVADAFGVMMGDQSILDKMVQDDRNLVQKIVDAFHDMLVKVQRALSGGQSLSKEQRAEFAALENKLGTMSTVFEQALQRAGEAYETNGGKAAPKDVSSDFAEAKYSVAPPYRPNSEALQRWVDEMSNEASETYALFNDVNQIGGDISKKYMLPSEWNEKIHTDAAFAETARKIAERVPENIRKNAHINEDGTITETPFEKEFRMERSLMQRLVDSLPMETVSSTVESNGRKIKISNKPKVNTVGGEAYRRALLDERRQMYKEGRLPTKSIGGLSKDTWGAMGFLATNGKTGASGDFTTLCPQMYYNKGCFYCYRRAALTTGVNNKLVGENVWYTGEVLQLKQEDIDNLNKNGGLRIQSFGDWMEQYSSQLADLLMDAETVGLQIKIITKEPSMIDTVALLRDQGIGKNLYFNLSSDYTIEEQGRINNQTGDGAQPRNPFRPYMKQEDGRTFWKRALTVEEANEYRKKYPWVNTRIVATTVDEFLEGLRSPMVDVVTGYHGNIRQFERVSSATGETLLQVEPLGDAGMPRFAFNPKTGNWTLEFEGKTATHKKLAKAIEDAGLQMQYYIKSCCITGRCATCEGKCGKLARDFNVKNATNADKQSVAYWQKHMTSAEDNPLLLDQMEDDQAKALLDAELNRGKYSVSTKELLQQYAEQYGAIDAGEKPAREISFPKRTTDKTKTSLTARTIAEAGVTTEPMLETIEDMVANHEFDYTPYSDEKAINNASSYIEKKGFQKALSDWSGQVKNGSVSKTNTAIGWALYNNAVTAGDMKAAADVARLMSIHERSAGQALQAARILKKMNPESRLYSIMQTAQDLQDDLVNRYGDKAPEIKVDEDLAQAYLEAKTEDEREKIEKKIKKDLTEQTPLTWMDRWTAFRYTCMLGNLRTIGRNIAGNAGFAPVVLTKDAIATAIEAGVYYAGGKKLNRTKGSVLGHGDLLKAAWNDYANVQEAAMGESKYQDKLSQKGSKDREKIFGQTKSKAWNKTGGAVLEGWRRTTNKLMDVTDVWFNKPQYAFAMAQYCAANGITAEQIAKGEGLNKAREYAITEAQKATYRDTNDFSQAIAEMGKSWLRSENKWKKGIATLGEGIMPFRKTPANIASRIFEYSPAGLLKSLTYDLSQVKKGNMSGAQMIDDFSSGLTGSGLLALGVYLGLQGILRGRGGSDDKKKKFDELTGHQDYALEIGNTSVTLDWLAPQAVPMFIGANLAEAIRENKELRPRDIWSAISSVTEPVLSMSMLQSLNDLLESKSYGDDDASALVKKIVSGATSYLTQAVPTLLGQIERTGESKRMTTYTDKNNKWLTSDMQYTLGKISAKVPIFDVNQIPYIDAWGREELTGSFLGRAANNFVNPAYLSKVNESEMEKEIERLYDSTGEGGVFPQRAAKYFTVDGERKDLTADEYVKYASVKGQTAYVTVDRLTKSNLYNDLSDAEKAACVKEAYKYADQTARTEVGGNITESWVEKAKKGVAIGIQPETYILVKNAVSDVEGIKDANGKTISDTPGLKKMEIIYSIPGLNDEQRQYLFDCFGVGEKIKGYNKALVTEKLAEIPKQQENYASITDRFQSSALYGKATDRQRDAVESSIRDYTAGNTNGQAIADKISGGASVGLTEDEYFQYALALKIADADNKDPAKRNGSYDQTEAEAALDMLSGLSKAEKSYLWQTTNSGWKEKNNPFGSGTSTGEKKESEEYVIDVSSSSALSSARYDPATQTAYITYRSNGRTYAYDGITKEEWNKFKNSSSKGSYVRNWQ